MKALTFVLAGLAALAALAPGASAGQLKDALAPLEPFIGTWEVEAKWANGEPTWARTRYEPALDGHFLAAQTLVIEQNGTLYERYRSMIASDPDRGVFPIHSFTHTGQHRVLDFKPDGDGRFTVEWSVGDTQLRELTALKGDDRMEWKVWTKSPKDEDWVLALDAEWRKTGDTEPLVSPRLPLTDAVSALRPMLGTWEVNTNWPDGVALWSLLRTDAAPGGAFLASTVLARDGDAQPYERYRSFIVPDPDGGFSEVSFTHKGAVNVAHATMTAGAQPAFESTIQPGPGNPLEIVKRYEFMGDNAFHWTVNGRQPGSEAWSPIAEGTWRRVSRPTGVSPMPIDPSLFAASGPGVRSFTRETTIAAPAEAVFNAWATKAGWEDTYADGNPNSIANIDLAIGGPYEWLFNGVLGSNGCQVLSYIPNRMISFSWNAPPTQPAARTKRTWVVVELTPEGQNTKVVLTHLGFGSGPQWDETYAYFGKAWDFVLNRMKTVLETELEE